MNMKPFPQRPSGFARRAFWTGSTRTVGDTTYRRFDDGSNRLAPPAKIRGKSARRAEKLARRLRKAVA